jgi:hypothetical protein
MAGQATGHTGLYRDAPTRSSSGGREKKKALGHAIGVAGIVAKGKRVRIYSTVGLINELEKEKREGKEGRIALALMCMDLVILDELDFWPSSRPVVPCCFTCSPSCTSTPVW